MSGASRCPANVAPERIDRAPLIALGVTVIRHRRMLPVVVALVVLTGALLATFFALVAADPATFEATGRTSTEAMVAFGIKDDTRIDAGYLAGLVRAGLVHLSPTHLAVNTAGLVLFAALIWRLVPLAERSIPRALTIVSIAIMASTGGFALSYFQGNGLSAGASGAVFGLLGALPLTLATRTDLAPPRLRWTLAAALLGLGLLGVTLLGADTGVDHAAHLGGLLTGLPLGYVQSTRPGRTALSTLGLALIVLGFTPA